MALDDVFAHVRDPDEREALISIARVEMARRRRRAAEVEYKRCPRCQVLKPRTAFGASHTRYDGVQGHCRDCRSRKKRKEATPFG